MKTYKINEFSQLLNRSVRTLQRWDKDGILVANRNPKDRRYYTHDQYLKYIGIKADDTKKIASIAAYPVPIKRMILPAKRKH